MTPAANVDCRDRNGRGGRAGGVVGLTMYEDGGRAGGPRGGVYGRNRRDV